MKVGVGCLICKKDLWIYESDTKKISEDLIDGIKELAKRNGWYWVRIIIEDYDEDWANKQGIMDISSINGPVCPDCMYRLKYGDDEEE